MAFQFVDMLPRPPDKPFCSCRAHSAIFMKAPLGKNIAKNDALPPACSETARAFLQKDTRGADGVKKKVFRGARLPPRALDNLTALPFQRAVYPSTIKKPPAGILGLRQIPLMGLPRHAVQTGRISRRG